MSEDDQSNLPAQIAKAISGIPSALVPSAIKALDRLIGAAVDIPTALLVQKKTKIEAQTQAYSAVETAISNTVAAEAGADPEIVQQALNVLVRKEYRKQVNRQAVSEAMIEDLRSQNEVPNEPAPDSIDDDWLNVFERYAEDASTERMQNLWGRVLGGELRDPGKYSMRTLRFLSEFSQMDAQLFAELSLIAFGDSIPKSLMDSDDKDITKMLHLETTGLIQGADGLGLQRYYTFNANGDTFVIEGNLALWFKGNPDERIQYENILLTPLGRELLTLIADRDPIIAATNVARAIRTPALKLCQLARVQGNRVFPIKVLWDDTSVENTASPT